MNIFYRIFIMAFINGATAVLYTIIFNREISCQTDPAFSQIKWVIISFFAGALAAVYLLRGTILKKNGGSRLNLVAALSPVAVAFFVPAMIFLIRMIRPELSLSAGMAGPVWLGPALCFVSYLPAAALSTAGFMPLAELPGQLKSRQALYFLYISEIAGAITAAAVFYAFLAGKYSNVDVVYVAGIVSLIVVYFFFRSKDMQGRYIMLTVIVALIIYMAFNVAGFKERVDAFTSKEAFNGYEVIADREFSTMKFTLAKKDGVYYVFENGSLVYTIPDTDYRKLALYAAGPDVLVINGVYTGLVDELSTIKSVTDITAVEDDPYTAYILDKLFKPVISGDKKVTYISGDGALDPSILSTGRIFDTVILSCARVKPGKYGRKYLEKIRDNFLKPGGELVINISHSNADEIFVAVKGLFKAISMSQGVIIAK